MDIIEVVGQVRELLQQQGRLSYRIVRRQFALDDEALEDLKFELIDVQEMAVDKDGKMLVWKGLRKLPQLRAVHLPCPSLPLATPPRISLSASAQNKPH